MRIFSSKFKTGKAEVEYTLMSQLIGKLQQQYISVFMKQTIQTIQTETKYLTKKSDIYLSGLLLISNCFLRTVIIIIPAENQHLTLLWKYSLFDICC